MKTRFTIHRNEEGSILAVTLVLTMLLGITLGSYLYWVRTQNVLVTESQAWNSALTIAEAGIEEGMAQINVNVGNVGSPNLLDYSASMTANGWPRTNALGYTVTISNDAPPTIYSSGIATVPLVGRTITRTVMVKTSTNSLFGIGIAAIQNITMNGFNVYVDAFDSADTVHFTNGLYNSTYAFAKGDVASTTGLISVGNAKIHGRLILAPGATDSLGPNGLVGDMPANWPAQIGIETPTSDWLITDFNKDFPDVATPYTTGLSVPYYNSTNTYLLSGGSYYNSGDLTLKNKDTLYVTGASTLYVTGNFNGNNGSTISIANGATLKLYVGTQNTASTVGITFDTVNNAGNAANFQLYGLPSATSFTLNGNGAYIGTVYTPEAALTYNGGGMNTLDFQGACVVYSATVVGHFNIHYDVNLSRIGPPSGYTCSSWKEL